MSNLILNGYPKFDLKQVIRRLQNNPNDYIIIRFPNTKYVDNFMLEQLKRYSNRVTIQIIGGYDHNRISNYPNASKRLSRDNIYTISEMENIMKEIKIIEDGMNRNWDELQKLIYFVGKLGDRIIYHPFHEVQPSRDIRSLRGLFSGKTVCAGYAIILKELCDRHNIKCDYVEGACNEDDYNKNYLTHAWNIVTIQGKNIPVDLTWHAGKARQGNIMAIENIGNANAFVKDHYPGKHERLQNYKQQLVNIDGSYLRTLNNIINKDSVNRNNIYTGIRDDNTKYVVVQDKPFLINDEYFMRYIYYDINHPNKLSKPIVLYSKTNVGAIVSACRQIKKWKYQLQEARKNRDFEEETRLLELINKTKDYPDINNLVDNHLFSKVNIHAALNRGDHYLGKIVDKQVEISPRLGRKIPFRQRTFTRNDNTSFVLEEINPLKLNNYKIRRYLIFETIDGNVKRNMVFSDRDLINDNRSIIPNEFLTRERINRKQRETNGYLGYMSDSGVRTYDRELNQYFQKDLALAAKFSSTRTSTYYPEVTFEEMKNLVKTYEFTMEGKIINRKTQQELLDKDLALRAGFALAWHSAAAVKYYADDPVPGYRYAFNEPAEKTFNIIYKMITDSVNKYGNIEPCEILDRILKEHPYKYDREIVVKLFGNEIFTNIINKLFRRQNPSAVTEKTINSFHTYGFSTDAYRQLEQYKREKNKELQDMLKVIDNGVSLRVVSKNI